MFLLEVIDALDKANLKYALVGGYALALHGIVRATMDIDLVLSFKREDFQLAEHTLNQIGLQSRLPLRAQDVFSLRKEYIEKRNLIAWGFVDFKNPTRAVDVILTENLRHLKTTIKLVYGHKIRVATLEELLRMKKLSGRPQDQMDIERILEALNETKKTSKK